MEKYYQIFFERTYETLQKWYNLDFVIEQDMYNFLHSLKGTAGSIGLMELSMIASEKLELLTENSDKQWEKNKWKKYLSSVIEAISFYQTNADLPNIEDNELYQTEYLDDQDLILVIDNDMVFISYIKNVLEKYGYTVIGSQSGKKGLELINKFRPAIVFLDIMLPDTNGFSILQAINKINIEDMLTIVTTLKDSKENRKRAYDMGAFDFITKPMDEEILVSYVTNRLMYKKQLERSIIIDELTQVYNRKFMEKKLQKLLHLYTQNGEYFSLAMMDLDYLKKVNSLHGHLAGDEVLRGFANLVMDAKRDRDIFCRYGGGEFVLLMPRTSIKEAYIIMEGLRRLIEQKYFDIKGFKFQIAFSAGIAQVSDKNLHPEKILEEANLALCNAKQSGRNKTVIFDSVTEDVKKQTKIKIIVIDDVFIIRNMLTSHFENWVSDENFDFEVSAYSDGESFINSNWYTPDSKYVILLDGRLPKMDGMEVLKEIRNKYSSSEVIISMLTARNNENYIVEALKNGADDYIVKPFDIEELSNRINNLINQLLI